MPTYPGKANLTLGRSIFDRGSFRQDTDPAVIRNLEFFAMAAQAAGHASPARSDSDPVFLQVFAQPDGLGAHILYGGNAQDPENPYVLTVSASGSADVIWQEEGSTVKTSGTVNFVGPGVTVTDEGDGKATVTIPGGGGGSPTNAFGTITVDGQSDVVADAAPDSVEFIAGVGMEITTNAGADEVTWNSLVLAFKTIAVSGQSSVVADSYQDTLTLVAGSNITLTTDATGDAITISSSHATYTAGAGINLATSKFIADPNTASHVGLVDPSTGNDSSGDNAQIGILWHEVAGYDQGRNMLYGHEADDATKPVVCIKTTESWLGRLEDYDAADRSVVGNDPGQAGGEGAEKIRHLPAPATEMVLIDPEGAHTIEASGTTLTITFKTKKHTFWAIKHEVEDGEDIELVYEDGHECEEEEEP